MHGGFWTLYSSQSRASPWAETLQVLVQPISWRLLVAFPSLHPSRWSAHPTTREKEQGPDTASWAASFSEQREGAPSPSRLFWSQHLVSYLNLARRRLYRLLPHYENHLSEATHLTATNSGRSIIICHAFVRRMIGDRPHALSARYLNQGMRWHEIITCPL